MRYLYFYFSLLLCGALFAQPSLPVPTNIQKAYTHRTRSMEGIPGVNYWQNKSQYDIQVKFDPKTRLITGEETITYTNNSPDTLAKILFKLFPNYYQKGMPRDGHFMGHVEPKDLTDGVKIEKLQVNGQEEDVQSLTIEATNMYLPIPALKPKEEIQFVIHWSYTLNETSHNRTGQVDEGSYFIAYFFPRIAVYDDTNGWNEFNYNGTQEFYNDFDDFNVEITVPDKYIVWATGTLQNPNDVLAPKFADRLQKAEKSDHIMAIISAEEAKRGEATRKHSKNTWHYQVDHITDFVFATSDHYMWEASSIEVDPKTKRRTRVDAVYNPAHEDYKEVAAIARQTIEEMSYNFPAWPYPFPHETVFDGLDQMEYPMMVNDNPVPSRQGTIGLTIHEIFHSMFPFYMGTNETKYAFMDEGWASVAGHYIAPKIDSTLPVNSRTRGYERIAGSELDLPMITPSINLSGAAYTLNAYTKPSIAYGYLKEMLGDELFTTAMHHYIASWNGKHPLPWDFFNSFNKASGKNLNWFWKRWFFDRGYPDLAIQDVKQNKGSYTVKIEAIGNKPVPINLTFHFSDGSIATKHLSIETWKDKDETEVIFESLKQLQKVELGDGVNDADIDRSNNVFILP